MHGNPAVRGEPLVQSRSMARFFRQKFPDRANLVLHGKIRIEENFSPPRRQVRQVKSMANRNGLEWKPISDAPIWSFLGALGVLAVQIYPIRAVTFPDEVTLGGPPRFAP